MVDAERVSDRRYEFGRAMDYLGELLEWLGDPDADNATSGEIMEYLWGEVPLRYKDDPQVAEEIRVTLGQYFSRRFGLYMDNVAWEERTFRRRMRDITRVPRDMWLYELRRILLNEGFEPRPGSPWATAEFPNFDISIHDGPPPEIPQGFEGFPPFEQLAADCAAIADIKALIDVIGDGSKLTAKGNLSLADAERLAHKIGVASDFNEKIGDRVFKTRSSTHIELVDLAFRWARADRLVKVAKGTVTPTKAGRAFGNSVPIEWWCLFVTFVRDLKWPAKRWPEDRRPFWADEVGGLWRIYLESIRDPDGIDIETLREWAWHVVERRWDIDDLHPEQIEFQKSMVEGSILKGFFEPLSMLNAIDPATLNGRFLQPTALGRWAAERFACLMEDRFVSTANDPPRNVIWLDRRKNADN
jgi:hypothetical protein